MKRITLVLLLFALVLPAMAQECDPSVTVEKISVFEAAELAGLSPDTLLMMGAAKGDGAAPSFCWLHTFTEPCGSCTLYWGAEGQKHWSELWCIGIMVIRGPIDCLWCP